MGQNFLKVALVLTFGYLIPYLLVTLSQTKHQVSNPLVNLSPRDMNWF